MRPEHYCPLVHTPRPEEELTMLYSPHKSPPYSSNIQLAQKAIQWLFLFVVGLAMACLISATFSAHYLVDVLMELAWICLPPLAVLTLCIIAMVILREAI
jgi:NADH:ubiquinone oxidoreductase subunit H